VGSFSWPSHDSYFMGASLAKLNFKFTLLVDSRNDVKEKSDPTFT